ncbi:glycosyltransferase family 2 protein [Hymenobacter sp. DH14]|uniref:Glycosyltransferase family 2 protein n=1 Tax=Hymenobacter cyanobacteriorum TaxID=2926463 RepID=A0A9X1VHV1_9BACT|nr:glycosyltransferase family 2 protein [Hymenobacter cyanobacteriorum]MCI1188910.1 glycosyltransferase family 2 protein [Hymenobacter cyanobacteriorum]
MVPKVSVLLPVYNVAPYIRETIASILSQTFIDFELIVVDDLSTDDTAAIVASISDDRIILIRNTQNLGRAGSDNAGLAAVRGQYIAKMDGDDICHPERLARQVAYLENHPEINAVGSWIQNFGDSIYLNRYPVTPEAVQVLTLFTLPIGNPTLMLRTYLFREGGMQYDAALRQTEDYDFFARYIRELWAVALPEVLFHYRVPPKVSKNTILTDRASVADEVRARLLSDWGLPYTERELKLHNVISMLNRPLGDLTLKEVEMWLLKIILYNDEKPLFEPSALRHGLGERWFEVCYTYPQNWLKGIWEFENSPLAKYFAITLRQRFKFWIKSLSKI